MDFFRPNTGCGAAQRCLGRLKMLLTVGLAVGAGWLTASDTLSIKFGFGGRAGGQGMSPNCAYGLLPTVGSAWTAVADRTPRALNLRGTGIRLDGAPSGNWCSYCCTRDHKNRPCNALFDRYLEDNTDHTLTVSGLDTGRSVTYDAYMYFTSDVCKSGKFYPVKANGTWYTAGKGPEAAAVPVRPAAGETVPVKAGLWGAENRTDPILNVNTLKITGLKAPNGALTLTVPAADRSVGRACLAALQLVMNVRMEKTETVTLDGTERSLSALAAGKDLSKTQLTLNCRRPTTLRADTSLNVGSLRVEGDAPLTLTAAGGCMNVKYGTVIAADTVAEAGAARLGRVTVEERRMLTVSDSVTVDSVELRSFGTDRAGILLVLPSKEQVAWADAEIGVLFHYDLYVFDRKFSWRKYNELPLPEVFSPTQLDTDQWARAVKALGAKYAIFTAKHCPGFCLWPTKTIEYNISKTPYGKDLVRRFTDSCRKYGIKPGLYCSTQVNGYLRVYDGAAVTKDSPVSQEEYGRIVKQQLTELWTNYGEFFELWFDGGAITEEQGGFSLTKLLAELQPHAIVFQGPADHPHTVRWIGNELGRAPTDCWSTRDTGTASGGVNPYGPDAMRGSPFGKLWCPGEADCTLRDYRRAHSCGWSWAPNQDHLLYSVDSLMQTYRTSVGRNTNMLVGMVIDDRGLVPDADVRRAEEFSAAVRARYGKPTHAVSGVGRRLAIAFPKPTVIDRVILQEDISLGERVLDYDVQGRIGGEWRTLASGKCIGHKQILEFRPVTADAVRLNIRAAKTEPHIRTFAVFEK